MACVTSCCCEYFAHQSLMDGDLKPRFLCRSFSPPLSCRWLGCHQKSDTPLQRSAVYKVCHGLPANCICRRYLLKQKGFYGVSYHIGFRDEFDVKVSSFAPTLRHGLTNFIPRSTTSLSAYVTLKNACIQNRKMLHLSFVRSNLPLKAQLTCTHCTYSLVPDSS